MRCLCPASLTTCSKRSRSRSKHAVSFLHLLHVTAQEERRVDLGGWPRVCRRKASGQSRCIGLTQCELNTLRKNGYESCRSSQLSLRWLSRGRLWEQGVVISDHSGPRATTHTMAFAFSSALQAPVRAAAPSVLEPQAPPRPRLDTVSAVLNSAFASFAGFSVPRFTVEERTQLPVSREAPKAAAGDGAQDLAASLDWPDHFREAYKMGRTYGHGAPRTEHLVSDESAFSKETRTSGLPLSGGRVRGYAYCPAALSMCLLDAVAAGQLRTPSRS